MLDLQQICFYFNWKTVFVFEDWKNTRKEETNDWNSSILNGTFWKASIWKLRLMSFNHFWMRRRNTPTAICAWIACFAANINFSTHAHTQFKFYTSSKRLAWKCAKIDDDIANGWASLCGRRDDVVAFTNEQNLPWKREEEKPFKWCTQQTILFPARVIPSQYICNSARLIINRYIWT